MCNQTLLPSTWRWSTLGFRPTKISNDVLNSYDGHKNRFRMSAEWTTASAQNSSGICSYNILYIAESISVRLVLSSRSLTSGEYGGFCKREIPSFCKYGSQATYSPPPSHFKLLIFQSYILSNHGYNLLRKIKKIAFLFHVLHEDVTGELIDKSCIVLCSTHWWRLSLSRLVAVQQLSDRNGSGMLIVQWKRLFSLETSFALHIMWLDPRFFPSNYSSATQ